MHQDHLWKNAFWTHFRLIFGPKTGHFQGILRCSMGQNASPRAEKWAKNTFLSIANGPASLSVTMIFDPFFTHFWFQNVPFSRHFGIFHGPKRPTTGSQWAKNTCLNIPNGPGSVLEKRGFDPFLTHFWLENGPFSRYFGIFHGPKRITTGSKWVKNTCVSSPNGPRSLLEKRAFDPFLTHFWSQNGPSSSHLGIFHGPKRVTSSSKWAKNFFERPTWSRIGFGKMRF